MKQDQKLMVVTDLDGTYLDPSGTVPTCASEFAQTLNAMGAEFAVATGRSPHNVAGLFHDWQSAFFGLCSEGGIVTAHTRLEWRVIAETLLDHAAAEAAIQTLGNLGSEMVMLIFSASKTDFAIFRVQRRGDGASFAIVAERLNDERHFMSVAGIADLPIDIAGESVRAVALFGRNEHIGAAAKAARTKLDGHQDIEILVYPEVRTPGYSWLDVMNSRISKGAALEQLLRTRAERPIVLALGNGENDLSLFRLADVKICPTDSSESVKREADLVLNATGGEYFMRELISLLQAGSLGPVSSVFEGWAH